MILKGFHILFEFFKLPILIFLGFCLVFGVLVLIHYAYLYFWLGMRPPQGEYHYVKKQSFLKRLFWDFPRAYAIDMMQKNPENFGYRGLVLFCGEQGSGKSIALAEFTRRMHKEFPKSKIIGNMDYKGQDAELNHWKQLLDYCNGEKGVIVQIDEMQNWFSSMQSKNFPPEMLEVATQNRKNRRIILGTSQVFCRVSKALREQVSEVRNCITLAGCLTIVIRRKPIINSEGIVEKMKYRGMYFFVHDKDLRDSYDTYKVIHSLSESGFQDRVSENKTVVNVENIIKRK